MKMCRIDDIFDVEYPRTMVLNKQKLDPTGVNFVSSKGTNNGVAARISETEKHKKYKAGAITVALKGSVMSAFLQASDFYIAHQTAVLYPKKKMSDNEKLFYCVCIRSNKYRFNYGRQADRTLREIHIPCRENVPTWVNEIDISMFEDAKKQLIAKEPQNFDCTNWKWFKIEDIFDIKKGKRLTKANMKPGSTPYIGAIDSNNGYRQFIAREPIHTGNTISVNYNGSVGEAYYQPKPHWATDDVNVLYPKFDMNQYSALFICTVIMQEKYRFNYGRKWHMERMNTSRIKLPVKKDGKPDYGFMEEYVKRLPFSKSI